MVTTKAFIQPFITHCNADGTLITNFWRITDEERNTLNGLFTRYEKLDALCQEAEQILILSTQKNEETANSPTYQFTCDRIDNYESEIQAIYDQYSYLLLKYTGSVNSRQLFEGDIEEYKDCVFYLTLQPLAKTGNLLYEFFSPMP